MRALLLTLALLAATCAASIEKEPVKVTRQNSGPRYDLDDVGRISLAENEASNNVDSNIKPMQTPSTRNGDISQPSTRQQSSVEGDDAPIGRLSIRRIFLIPMMGPMSDGDSSGHPSDVMSPAEPPREPLSSLFWPFMSPRQPPADLPPSRNPHHHHHHHLLGQDEASRGLPRRGEVEEGSSSMAAAASGEREFSAPPSSSPVDRPPQRSLFDPIQMMLDMMHHAISTAGNPMADSPQSNNPFFTDLNKDASERPRSGDDDNNKESTDAQPGTSLERPFKPQTRNETKEDIVEIDGRKYLRKTVISRHVGEDIVFMTKRLIFVPLNETDAIDSSTTTTPTPTTSSLPKELSENESKESRVEPEKTEATTTTTSTTTVSPAVVVETTSNQVPNAPTTSEAISTASILSSSAAPVEEATTTVASTVTPAKESWVERVSEAIDKAAERLIEKGSTEAPMTTTAAPAS